MAPVLHTVLVARGPQELLEGQVEQGGDFFCVERGDQFGGGGSCGQRGGEVGYDGCDEELVS